MIYFFYDLKCARSFLKKQEHKRLDIMFHAYLVNKFGIRVIDFMYKTIKSEFSNLVSDAYIDTGSNKAAYDTAVVIGYKYVIYNKKII